MLFSEKYKRQFIKQDEQQGIFFKKRNFPVVGGEICTHTLARARTHTHTRTRKHREVPEYTTLLLLCDLK